jgi:membrane protease YdiL (CAAX protease family)
VIVAPTAAFCEEFLFRGFLLTQLNHWFHSVGWAWVACSVAFGLAHSYQGWSGMIRAGLLGALLAYPVVRFGSLYPSILAHWLIDAVALVWLGRWLIPKDTSLEERVPE